MAHIALAAAEFGAAADELDEAAAAAFGVNRTDLRVVGLLSRHGRLTAGELATAAALSPAATSTAIQRLVGAGYLTRETDGADRRRAVLRLAPAAHALIDRVYGPLEHAGRAELERYSPAELRLIGDFLQRGIALQRAHARRVAGLRSADAPS